ncbi:hypothetical protein Pla52o_50060 [Novipirellula galeiformis]|uniref:Uncharacterized protein n=1 Tax=Novipirellula galeiformis TaxID=2528004 RepID=A0A5C6C2B5_9BACT|nr:hypothetical protein [Novipirellula galeiformis]TWU17791.1 hypothetical protein Pla52o_50060 [Novipirellula galeiformis]
MLLVFVSLCSLVLSGSVGIASDTGTSEPVWAAVVQHSSSQEGGPKYHVTITSGARFDLISTIVDALAVDNPDKITLAPKKELELKFHSSPILVLKVDKRTATIAPDDRFPYAVTESLAKSLKSLGTPEIHVSALDDLLKPLPELKQSGDPFGDPFHRRFAFRQTELVDLEIEGTEN